MGFSVTVVEPMAGVVLASKDVKRTDSSIISAIARIRTRFFAMGKTSFQLCALLLY